MAARARIRSGVAAVSATEAVSWHLTSPARALLVLWAGVRGGRGWVWGRRAHCPGIDDGEPLDEAALAQSLDRRETKLRADLVRRETKPPAKPPDTPL